MVRRLSDLPAAWRERCQCQHLCLEVLGGGGALLLTPSWFLLFIPVAAAFFQSESAGVGSNSVCKCVQSGKSHVSILLLGKTIHKNILMLVSRVAS